MKDLEKFKNLGEILSKAQLKKILGGYTYTGIKCCDADGTNCSACVPYCCGCTYGASSCGDKTCFDVDCP